MASEGRLDPLLVAVVAVASEDRLDPLLVAVVAVASDLSLPDVLRRIVESARELVGAQYGALGSDEPSGQELSDFLTVGVDQALHAKIVDLPQGRGVLGLLITEPRPLHLPRHRRAPRVVRLARSDHPRPPGPTGFPASHTTNGITP